MADWAEWVWLNGRLERGSESAISVCDRSFLLGDGLFETMRARRGRVFRLDRHLARLRRGAEQLHISLPAAPDALAAAVHDALRANSLQEAALRLTISRGVGVPGLAWDGTEAPVIVIAARPFSGYPERWYQHGASAIISTFIKNERSPLCGFKTTSFVEHVAARAEAAGRGADEALLLNTRGYLVEGSNTNLFAVIEGCLHTPDLRSGCIPGITREAVLELAREAGLVVFEAPLMPAALPGADEAFLTNSLLDVAPLVRVEGRLIGGGAPGPITQMLADRYRNLAAEDAPVPPGSTGGPA
jgi:branched-chain amino acid aminotransferase